jgi:hypothetical protein
MTGFGPIFQLQVFGAICPCLEKSENKNARHAVAYINSTCRRVQWIPSAHDSGGKSNTKGFLNGWFGGGKADDSSGGTTPIQRQQPCRAKIILRDSGGDGQPEMFIEPIGHSAEEGSESNNQGCTKQNLKLRRVDKVSLDGDQIVLSARPSLNRRELLRFMALQYQEDDETEASNTADAGAVVPVSQDTRNTLVHHFMVIAEWERQRRDCLDADGSDDDDDDNEARPNFLQSRAQKAAHFARREIELQKTKRDRETRKAKLVAEAGGLKYTAIAMANMHSPS